MVQELEQRPLSPTANRGRRVVASTFVTLDGYMVGPDEDMSWVVEGSTGRCRPTSRRR
jgi:hypothetical protein